MSDTADVLLSDAMPISEYAKGYDVDPAAIRYYRKRWPECFVRMGNQDLVIRPRMEARLRANLFRPKKRKQPPPSPTRAGEVADVEQQ